MTVLSMTPDSDHLGDKIVALTRERSPTPGKDRVATVLLGDVADELLDDDGLADAGATEDADLAALGEGARSRSMTLMPVSNTSVAVAWSSKDGAGRWMG